MKSIGKKITYTATGILGSIALLCTWGLIEPHILNQEEETATLPNLSQDWEGKQIGHISDFQIGMWLGNPGTARRSVEVLIEAKPAAVLYSGDFIYHAEPAPEAEIEEAVSIMQPLVDADIPVYAVLGNHDYGMSAQAADPATQLASKLEVALEEAGIVVLENESVAMSLPNSTESLYVAAVDSRWANQADVTEALSGIPENAPRIALMHNPDSFEAFPANTAPLALAGHTHGGQIRVPGMPQWSWLRFSQKDKVYSDGWAIDYGNAGNDLYVNVGIGMSIIPVRLFCPPEVTLFTLTRSQDSAEDLPDQG